MPSNEAVKNPIPHRSMHWVSRTLVLGCDFLRHGPSVPQIRAIALTVAPPGPSCLLLRIPILRKLLNVVHHAIQVLLRVGLLAPTVIEAGQSFVGS
jgi:hypothetical protein